MENLLLTEVSGQVTEHFYNKPHVLWGHQSRLSKFLITVKQSDKKENYSFVSALYKTGLQIKG